MTTQTNFTPSRYQQAIFDFVAEQLRLRAAAQPFRHLIVDSTAGSGKTLTIIETCRRLPPHTRALVVAFNVRVADELKTRLPSNATALTLHSLGKRAWGTYLQVHPKTVVGRAGLVLFQGHTRNTVVEVKRIADA